jgi:hypothetical protein
MAAVNTAIYIFYFFRLRATIRPARPKPINAIEPGSGTAAIWLTALADIFARPQPARVPVQAGGSAKREVDVSKRSAALAVFMSSVHPW